MFMSKLSPKNWSLKLQLLMVLFFTLWLVIIASSYLIRYFESNRQIENLEDRSHHTVELTATVLGQAIVESDLVALELFIYDTIFQDVNILKAQVYDADGNELLTASTNEIGNEMLKNPGSYVTFADPIMYLGEMQGTIELTWNKLYVDRLVEERDRQTQSLFDPLLLTLGVLILIFGYIFVARPMDMISSQIQLLLETQNKDLADVPPLKLSHAREWSQLSKSTNLLQNALIESQQREQSLKEARDMAIRVSKIKSEFLTNISHELRTPLNGIIGMSDLMMDTKLDAEQKEYSEIIRSSGNDLLDIISKILSFSSIEDGTIELDNQLFDVLAFMQSIVQTWEPIAAEKGIKLSFKHDLAQTKFMGDEARISQVLNNLVENAIKFTDQGSVQVNLAAAKTDKGQVMLKFEVTDTGIGVDPAFLPDLFEPFSQLDGSLTRQYSGNGLGLAITQNLVQLMGGDISVQSELGTGSTFALALPVDTAENTDGLMEVKAETSHVLLLEPNLLSRKLLLIGLRKLNYSADFISNAIDMDACITTNRYSHVLIDGDVLWQQLQQNETELKELKKRQLDPAKWILLISSDDLRYKISDLFDAVLVKPVSVKQLAQTLDPIPELGQPQQVS